MFNPLTWLTHAREVAHYYLSGLYNQVMSKLVFIWAQAIAFKVLIAVVPVIILLTGILGQVLRRSEPFMAVRTAIVNFLPPYQSEQLVTFLHNLQDSSGALTIVGAIGLFLAALSLFTTLRVVIASVFQEDWHQRRSILGGYAFDARMVVQVGVLFLLTLSLSTFTRIDPTLLQQVGLDYEWIRAGWRSGIRLFSILVPFLLTVTMFFQLFYFIPKPHPPKRCALLGTFVTAVLWELAKNAFTLYASYVSQFTGYGSAAEGSLAGLGNAFGLLIAFVLWAYFSGVVLIVGAIIALMSEKRLRHRQRLSQAERTRRKLAERARHGAPESQPGGQTRTHEHPPKPTQEDYAGSNASADGEEPPSRSHPTMN